MTTTARVVLAVIATAGWTSSTCGELLTRTWNGGDATWSSDDEWSPAGAPNNNGADTFHAVVPTGAALLDQDITISELSVQGGTIAGGNSLTVLDSLNWSGGRIGGEGTLTLAGATTIDSSGGWVELAGSRQVVTQGATTVAGTTLYINSSGDDAVPGPVWTNQGAFAVTDESDFSLQNYAGGQPSFVNHADGVFTKSGADTQTDVSVVFNNDGTVNVDSGTLALWNDGADGGAYNVASGGRLLMLAGTRALGGGSSLATAGVLQVSGGQLTIGGTATINELVIDGGALEFGDTPYSVTGPVTFTSGFWGSAADLTLNSSLNWSGGRIGGEGTLTLAGATTIDSSGGWVELPGSRQVVTQGATTVSGTTLYVYSTGDDAVPGPVWTNQGAFAVTDESDFSLQNYAGGQPSFVNHADGVFTKSGADTQTDVSVVFNNDGTVNVDSGTLAFSNSYLQTGGTLRLNGGAVAASQPLELQGGALEGHGVITGDVSNNAVISPNGPSGVLTIDGDLTLGVNSLIDIAVGGSTAGTGYGYLTEAGFTPLSLAGALAVTLTGEYTPDALSTFVVLRSNEDLTGALTNVANGGRLYTTDDSGSFLVSYGESSPFNNRHLVLSSFVPILPGDYNDDGRVDAADYTVWRDNLGSGVSLTNDSTPGVGPDDYLRWRNNFGRTDDSFAGGPSLSAGAAPEPGCWPVLLALLALRRRRG
ncbi:hypothetical protein KOR34_47140 [Posidoniimonas corsicana]|uniref:Autotransporter-associated beta strand repeat protein n=1 Tax=Posidoniimonas corsicana TaxID=1938618 RepID=A0A5C5UYB5_9BACT|nr:hypothetical protein [Posidoniimonas corsicana]TWT31334.1 hypothetical protein KOR34_47140 [Posidoniimonas corsicana]